jgi:hypothetical protein
MRRCVEALLCQLDHDAIEKKSQHDLIPLIEHDLFGKPVSTFPDHAPTAILALTGCAPTNFALRN